MTTAARDIAHSPFLLPDGCHTETPITVLSLARKALRAEGGYHAFCVSVLLAPMPISHVGRLKRWVEHTRPYSIHPLCLDTSTEKAIIDLFAKNGLHVEVVRASDLPLNYVLRLNV